jgi:DNA polymerase III delta prime subunit
MTENPLIGQDTLFQTIRDSYENLPHIFVTGPSGSGKTSFLHQVIAMIQKEAPFEIDQILWLSSEKDRGIHTIREKVTEFCKRSARTPKSLRWVIIDDADSLPLISQQALRRPMEQYVHLTRFLFASRHASHLIEPLRSRCLHLELEPLSPVDLLPFFAKQYKLTLTPQLQDYCVRNFISLNEMRVVFKLKKALEMKGISEESIFTSLISLIPTAKAHTNELLSAIANQDACAARSAITQLYLNGYLLDDILLSIEHSIAVFPSTNPDIRYRVLRFTMLGWISIQQGKEHWMDAMDIIGQVFSQDS